MATDRRLMLVVIDAMKPSMLERVVRDGRAPFLQAVMERGTYDPELVAAFPSVTPVCAASIATGAGPDEHHIPAMNWYSREEKRYVEYGTSFGAARRFGITRQLTDTVYNMNGTHLSKGVETVFERLDDAGVRTAGTTYLMYRGRHRHEVDRETVQGRVAATLFRHPVMGPRELFYADLFASRPTPCRSQLGLPGVRDRHSGCVGAHLVEQDLCDFLLLSLPDNDAWSHKHGPHAQEESIVRADEQLVRVADAAGGVDAFLDRWAVVVCSDHSQAPVERPAELLEGFAQFGVLRPSGARADEAEVAVCPSSRSASVYALVPEGRDALVPRLVATARDLEGTDLVLWRTRTGEGAIAGDAGELRFAPAGGPADGVADARGARWDVEGDLDVLGAELTDDGTVLAAPSYPLALSRAWSALTCPTAGDVLLSAAPGFEFRDWGGALHVGGGSHGSLHAADSVGALLHAGVEGAPSRPAWTLRDVAPLCAGHFGA